MDVSEDKFLLYFWGCWYQLKVYIEARVSWKIMLFWILNKRFGRTFRNSTWCLGPDFEILESQLDALYIITYCVHLLPMYCNSWVIPFSSSKSKLVNGTFYSAGKCYRAPANAPVISVPHHFGFQDIYLWKGWSYILWFQLELSHFFPSNLRLASSRNVRFCNFFYVYLS